MRPSGRRPRFPHDIPWTSIPVRPGGFPKKAGPLLISSTSPGRWSPFLAPLLLLLSCEPYTPPEWHEEDGYRWHELTVPGRGGPGFTRMSPDRTGIGFRNELDPQSALDREHLLIGSGVALGDVDGDGLPDVYLARLEGPNALYRNLGGWRFEEITDQAGVALADRNSTGAAFADVDGNGHLDLIVTALGAPNTLLLNDGRGRFVDVGDWAGSDSDLGSSTVSLADVNGNGALDLYLANYKVESANDIFRPYDDPDFRLVIEDGDSVVIDPEYREHFRLEERNGERVAVEQAHPDHLYLNDGTGGFERVPWNSGRFLDAGGRPLEREVDDFALAARFYDVTGNGAPDLYVCNDFDDPDQLWLNDGTGTFHQAPASTLRTTSHASMSVDFTDVDRDGRVDLFVADMLSPDPRRRVMQRPLHAVGPRPPGRIHDRPQFQRNTLQRQRPDGTFAQIAELAGVDASDWTWGSVFVDVDLDGYDDLLVANGHGRDMQNADALERITRLRGRIDWREAKTIYPELETRNMAFRNRGDLTFEDVSEAWGFGTEPDVSHGVALADLSGNGALDVVVNRLGAPAAIFRNDATAPRVAVSLRGEEPNTRGVGAKVRLLGGAVPVQEREVTAGGLYLSHSDYTLSFAAGDAEELTVEVRWRSGRASVVEGVRPNRRYEIHESAATESWTPQPFRLPGRAAPDEGGEPTPLFEDASHLLAHTHPERPFDDFGRQPLLPFEVGRLGPGVAWSDLDGSGRPDLVVTPGAGGRLSWLRNDGPGFTPVWLEDEPGELDRAGLAVVPDGRGGRALLVGQSNWEVGSPDDLPATPSVLRAEPGRDVPGGEAVTPAVEGAFSSTGPLAVADLDANGELDLFVGGRAIPSLYPLAASSRLFRPRADGWALHPASEELFSDVGLVSAAVFSDLTGNGFPDLLLALDWGTPRLFLNDGAGALAEATADWGLDGLEGRWNGVATGDLTGDGRMGVVLTSWGRNVRDRPLPDRPLLLYQGDLDGSGGWSMVMARPGPDGRHIHPLERYERLREAWPGLTSRIPDFEAYGNAGMEEILGRDPATVPRLRARSYDHLLLLNRGDRFEARSLPLEAQLAPAFAALVFDADGDGREDVFLSQNVFAVEPYTPRLDAGRGLLLRGDGRGSLEPMPGSVSGIRVYGEQRGAAVADFDGDGRPDLAVSQNGAATRLFRNTGAKRGLRVRLRGPRGNPDGIGARIRLVYGDREGPAREIQGGTGYWSVNGPVQVMGTDGTPDAVRVRWPGGRTEVHPIAPDTWDVTISWRNGDPEETG